MDDIAIVGLACRFPGEATSESNLWDNVLAKGVNTWSEFPSNRFNADGFQHPDNQRQGSVSFLPFACLPPAFHVFLPLLVFLLQFAFSFPLPASLLHVAFEFRLTLHKLAFRGAHFLKEDPGAFDCGFFDMNPNDAIAADPQQRKLLEVSYEALQNGKSSSSSSCLNDFSLGHLS